MGQAEPPDTPVLQIDVPFEHQALSGTPEHGFTMPGRPDGSGWMTTPVDFG